MPKIDQTKINNPFLRFDVRFDVALGGAQRFVSRQHLNVPQRATNVEIVRAALVMNVRRPEWLEQPCRPAARYHCAKRFTMTAADVRWDRSVVKTKGEALRSSWSF